MDGEVRITLDYYHELIDNSGCSKDEYFDLKKENERLKIAIKEISNDFQELQSNYNQLVEENRDLKAKISFYKKQYE